MSDASPETPGQFVRTTLRQGWNTLLAIYYANSLSWRALKAGALFVFGFFLWAGSNVVLSYQRGWTVLHYTMAYGFVLILYGPFQHLVVIPVYQRLRRRGTNLSLGDHLHLPNAGLALFLVLVVVLGTFPPAVMTLNLRSSLEHSGVDINPDLLCVKSTGEPATIHCHLTDSTGIDKVVVESGRKTLAVDDEPPFEFDVSTADLTETTGQKRFRVELLDENGSLIRRYTRTASMIETG